MGKKARSITKVAEAFIKNGHILTTEQQVDLMKPFERKEVKAAIFQIDSNKSPWADGYSSGFFKSAWPIIGEKITDAVLEFFKNEKLLRQLNATNIALIPKLSNPEYASQFRPISCCNVLYKCISKLLCSRLKVAIQHLVADNQSAFVHGRSMLHNVLICHDILRHYNRKTSPRCLMKIDMRKAYDMVNWEFLEEVLIGYGFPIKFTELIMACVTSTKFSISVNGESHGFFEGKGGLRQGDPVSPLLFVLVIEYLSRTLGCMSALPNFKFHPMCKHLKLTHLVFADDPMVFCKGETGSVNRVLEALAHFSSVSGSVANMEKSSLFMACIDDHMKEVLLSNIGFSLVTFPIKYLGLPLSPKKWSTLDCYQLVEKITNKIKFSYAK